MKTEFKELHDWICNKCKKNDACQGEYKRLFAATTEKEILEVLHDNIAWCISNNIFSHEYFNKFDKLTFIESGIANTGKENTGWANSGNRNSGYSNSGNRNSGNWNSGNRNSGNRNSGYSNSGYRNSGNWNSGNRNSGDSNSGYRNSGAFCTDPNPKAIIFNKESSMTVKEWENSKACRLMNNLDFTFWISSENMNDAEKASHPKHETTGGYLKTISHKEGWINFWGNLSDENKQVFTDLENFDANIFEEITGIKITK